jgi:hypothetical protein
VSLTSRLSPVAAAPEPLAEPLELELLLLFVEFDRGPSAAV